MHKPMVVSCRGVWNRCLLRPEADHARSQVCRHAAGDCRASAWCQADACCSVESSVHPGARRAVCLLNEGAAEDPPLELPLELPGYSH